MKRYDVLSKEHSNQRVVFQNPNNTRHKRKQAQLNYEQLYNTKNSNEMAIDKLMALSSSAGKTRKSTKSREMDRK